MGILDFELEVTLDEENERRLYNILYEQDMSITNSFVIKDKFGNIARFERTDLIKAKEKE